MLEDCFNLSTTGMYPGQLDALETTLAEIGKLVEGGKYREALDRLAHYDPLTGVPTGACSKTGCRWRWRAHAVRPAAWRCATSI